MVYWQKDLQLHIEDENALDSMLFGIQVDSAHITQRYTHQDMQRGLGRSKK